MWPQQAQAQVHQQAKAHIKAQSLEAWWERFTWASHKMIKSIMGFLHYSHGLKKSLKYEMMHEGSSLDLNWAIVSALFARIISQTMCCWIDKIGLG